MLGEISIALSGIAHKGGINIDSGDTMYSIYLSTTSL